MDRNSGKGSHKVEAPTPQRVRGSREGPENSDEIQQTGSPQPPSWSSFTPNTTLSVRQHRRPSYGLIEGEREAHYNLDYPENTRQLAALQLDPTSRFYARDRPRTLDLPSLLPYQAEHPRERAKFLSHIVAHLYIAIKTLDIQGAISVGARDLASLKNVPGLSDIDLALETNLFELPPSDAQNTDNDDMSYFDQNNIDFDDEDEHDDDGLIDDDSDEELEHDEEEANDDFETGDATKQHKKSPRSAAVVSVRMWTHELLVWMKMKYDMPVSLRVALAKVYFAICCCRGQHLNLKIYVKTFETLTKNVDLLQKQLVLPWEPVYNEISLHFPSPDALYEPLEKKDLSLLLKLGERASNFFTSDALPILFRHLGSHYSVTSATSVLWSMRILPQTFVENYSFDSSNASLDMRQYIAPLFHMWKILSKSSGIDSHLSSVLGRLSMAYLKYLANHHDDSRSFGQYGVYSQQQFSCIMNTLLNGLSINQRKFGSMKTKFFHGYSSAIVFSINGDNALRKDGILDQLDTLLNAFESYVHPSNSGEWSKPICKFIISLTYQFFKRYNLERESYGALYNLPQPNKLSNEVVKRFVRSILPLVRTGLQSKKNSMIEEYLVALGFLAHLDSQETLSFIILDIYESLQGLISTHRVITAMRCMEEVSRYFAATPLFRVHLPRLLEMILPGIDSNDLTKTIHTLDVFATVANFVPIADLSDGMIDQSLAMDVTDRQLRYLQEKVYSPDTLEDELIDPELEVQALKSSTVSFKFIMKSLAQRLFTLLRNIPDPSKSTGIEKYLCEMIPKLLYMVFEAMSDDIFSTFRDELMSFISEYSLHYIGEVIGELCGAVIKRDPAYYKIIAPTLIDRIKEEILENGAGQSRTGVDIIPRDESLFWNIIILNSCTGNAGKYIVDMESELREISFFLMENVKGPIVFGSTNLLHQILSGVSKIRLNESRLISPTYEKENKLSAECWGGFQFDDYRFTKENLDFEWYVPGEREITFAVEMFKLHITKALSNISGVLKKIVKEGKTETNTSLELSDELRANFLYLSYGISGMSYLFDPSFDEDIPKLSEHKNESIQKRLSLLTQIRQMKSAKSSEYDDSIIENIHEDLDRIVKDIESYHKIEIDDSEDTTMDNESMEKGFTLSRTGSNESIDETEADRPDLHASRMSESPVIDVSARGSPQLGGVEMSSMNPAVTFRERKLYTSKYFFGDDIDTRKANELYLQIHKMRYLVGKSLHFIFRFMQTHLYDNTKLFKHILYTLNIWFADVGRERLLDHTHARVSFSYANELQHINKMRKPFTRMCLGSRIESYHSLRVALHATSRSMTELDKVLIEDLVKLSFSTYTAIAEPAQSSLVDLMKRVNGSYNVITRVGLRNLARAIHDKNYKIIQSGLSVFELKRIRNKLSSDFFNLQKYIELLHYCFSIDDKDVVEISQRSFKELSGTVNPPRKYCLISHNLVDVIRPPDEFIDLEIRVVSLAKEKKRISYLDNIMKIENMVVANEKFNLHWKTSSLNLHFLIELQIEHEIQTSKDVFDLLIRAAGSDHPVVSKTALKGITKLLNKLEVLSSYQYNLENAYDITVFPQNFRKIDTHPKSGLSYYHTWKKELESTTPSYFVDYRMSCGWLFWDDEAIVVTNQTNLDLDVSESDKGILDTLSKNITKEWFKNVVDLWIADNDANFTFQGTDVFVTASIVYLISCGYMKHISFDDILDIISSSYDKNEKTSHIVACELITGILIASKNFNPNLVDKRDDFLIQFLRDVFENDLTPETKYIWNIFAWWTPAHVDSRRFPRVRDVILGFNIDKDSDSALMEATMLTYIKSFVSAITWATPNPSMILDLCFDNVTNRYETIRDQIGSLIVVTSFASYCDSFGDVKEFVDACHGDENVIHERNANMQLIAKLIALFEKTEQFRHESSSLSTQEVLKSNYIYCATTILSWLKQVFNTSVSGKYQSLIDSQIIPFLLNLMAQKEVCMLGNIDPFSAFKRVAQIPLDNSSLEKVIEMFKKYENQSLSLLQCLALNEFTEVVYFRNLFKLSFNQRRQILDFTNSLLYNKNPEIREASSLTFSGLIHITPPADVEEIVKSYRAKFTSDLDRIRKRHKKNGFKKIPANDLVVLHGATLGLGALVHAFSFISPPPSWIPEILSVLSNKASGLTGFVGRAAKDILGKFKKTRQDTWHVDSQVFSEEQMQDLEGVLWRSYIV